MGFVIFCLTILGLIFGAFCILMFKLDESRFMTCSTEGVIVDCVRGNVSSRNSAGHRHYSNMEAPVFEYYVKGVKYSCKSSTWYGGCKFTERVGTKVKVYYNPNKPTSADITKWGALRIVFVSFLSVVVICFSVDILLLYLLFI